MSLSRLSRGILYRQPPVAVTDQEDQAVTEHKGLPYSDRARMKEEQQVKSSELERPRAWP
jgi:hypothetical protein